MSTILVLGIGGNAGMNFVKSLKLSKLDFRIIGCDIDKYNLLSADCDAKYLFNSNQSSNEKIDLINGIIKKERVSFIHAQPDKEVEFLLTNSHKINAKIFDHDLDLWKLFSDKLYCQELWASKLGLGFKCSTLSEAIANPSIFDDLICHGKKVWFRAITGAGSKAALPVVTLDQARSWAQYWIDTKSMKTSDFMLAEYLPGDEYAVQTFWVNGTLVESQARQRLVYFFGSIMPSGQSSTPAVAVTVDHRDVYDTAYSAIKTIDPNPHGIYCVDLKRNIKGLVVPLEVNYGRFFTTSDFFSKLGVNTPYTYVNYSLTGIYTPKVEPIKTNNYWIRGLDREPFLARDLNFS